MENIKNLRNNHFIVGITGPSGSGKTVVSNFLKSLGFFIINADEISHSILDNNHILKTMVANKFDNLILNKSGSIDRKKLGKIVFQDNNKLKILNKIIFPFIKLEIKNIIFNCDKKIIFLDAPTLIESGLNKICNKIIVITASKEIRINRIKNRDMISQNEINNRFDSQLSELDYLKKADFIIRNDSNISELKIQITKIIDIIKNEI